MAALSHFEYAEPMITVYGIPNCDSVKKARVWLAENGHDYQFHDFKKQGVPESALDAWLAALGWEVLLNKQGTTWKKLPDEVKASVQDATSAKAVLLAHSSCIKRPVIDWGDGRITAGFKPEHWD
ncbi:MAG: ArsC family reductase [Brachymonas sp.]|jgi:arsenate reductase